MSEGVAILLVALGASLTLPVLVGLLASSGHWRRRRQTREIWKALEARRGWTRTGPEGETGIRGEIDGLAVSAEASDVSSADATRMRVTGLLSGLRLAPVRPPGQVWAGPPPPRVPTGDPAFDEVLLVDGPERAVRAALDAPTRELLLRLSRRSAMGASLVVNDGALDLLVRELPTGADALEAQLDELVRLARALEPGPAPWARLGEVARADPLPAVRAGALAVLLREAPEPAREAAVAAAAADPAPLVRVTLARVSGDVEGLVRTLLTGGALDGATRAAAAAAVEEQAEALRGNEGLEAWWQRAEADEATVRALGAIGGPGSLPLLLRLARDGEDASLRRAAARAAGTIHTRVGHDAAGRLQLADLGGELALVEEAGAVAVAGREDGEGAGRRAERQGGGR